jgi:type IV pilus assembly protein PilO
MPRSFKRFELPAGASRDPRFIARAALGVLLLANLLAAFAVFRPLGGSAEELDEQIATMRVQIQQRQAQLERLRALVSKIEQARATGDEFLSTYFMDRRTASSSIVAELSNAAKESGIRQKEHAFAFDPVEGSDTLSMMTITANYEGTYGDLLEFVNRLDKSPRFLILDTLTAAPQQGGSNLNVNIKLNTFVREAASST